MKGDQIDRLCFDWLNENYSKEIAFEYTTCWLVIPAWKSPDLMEALEDLRMMLSLAIGSEQSFRTTDYYEAREKLGLTDDMAPVPDIFLKAFARK